MTTYSQMHKTMDCPVCGKPLIESESQDKVACSNPNCKFNDELDLNSPYNINNNTRSY